MDAEAVTADTFALNPPIAPGVGGQGNETRLSASLTAAGSTAHRIVYLVEHVVAVILVTRRNERVREI